MKIIVRNDHFRALLNTAATEDVRYYLNGFLFDFVEQRLIATDGFALISVPILEVIGKPTQKELEQQGTEYGKGKGWLLFARPTKPPPKTSTKNPDMDTVEIDTEAMTIEYRRSSVNLRADAVLRYIDGPYPDYKAVMPKSWTEEGRSPELNTMFISRVTSEVVGKAACIRLLWEHQEANALKPLSPYKVQMFGAWQDVEFIVMPCRR